MTVSTIKIQERTTNKFSLKKLETFVNSEDFEDIILWYQMIKWETGVKSSFNSFKKELWL
jgi:hypothetical protein